MPLNQVKMNLGHIPNVELRGFIRKQVFYTIYCPNHKTDIKLPNKRPEKNCLQIETAMTYERFKQDFNLRDFRDFSCISIRFWDTCGCLDIGSSLKELKVMLDEKEDLYYATKILCIASMQDMDISVEENIDLRPPVADMEIPVLDNQTESAQTMNKEYFIRSVVNYKQDSRPEIQVLEDLLETNNLLFVSQKLTDLSSYKYTNDWWNEFRVDMLRDCLQEAIATLYITFYERKRLGVRENDDFHWWSFTTNGALYSEVINPALGIIDNHLTFPDEVLNRVGSEKDVENLSAMFSRKLIPHIVSRDSQIQHDDAIFEFLKHGNLRGLKELYVFIMSHGIENDIILSGDQQYAIYERIRKVIDNPLLKDVHKVFFIIACRGKIDPNIIEDKEKNDQNTDASMLDENTVVVHSVPKGHQSFRTKDGSVFIDHMLKICDNLSHSLTLDEFSTKMRERLKKCKFYDVYYEKPFDIVKKGKTQKFMSTTLTNMTNVEAFHHISAEDAPNPSKGCAEDEHEKSEK